MSKYYNAQRKRNMYDPAKPFNLSRSKIDLFMNCPRCFYLDRVKGVGRPPGYPFTLNLAVDELLKREFDFYRGKKSMVHPLIAKHGLDLVPANHPKLADWRFNFKGVQFLHKSTGLNITGAIDDLWKAPTQDLYYLPDYKATAKKDPVVEVNPEYGYFEQMDIYRWLLKMNGLNMSDTGFFVYANGKKDAAMFNDELKFDMIIIPYEGNDDWVEKTIMDAHACLNSETIPASNPDCDYCAYVEARERYLK